MEDFDQGMSRMSKQSSDLVWSVLKRKIQPVQPELAVVESMQAWYTVIWRDHIIMRSTLLKMDLSLLCLIIFSRLGRSYDQPRGGMWKGLQTLHNLKTTMWVMIPWCASTIKIYRYVCYIVRLEQLIASYSSYFSLSVFWPWLSTSILFICQCLQREVFKVTTFIQSSYLCSWVSHFYC